MKYLSVSLTIVTLVIWSCNSITNREDKVFNYNPPIDTIVEYVIPDIESAEGNNTIVYYSDGEIDSSTTYIYGETGQLKIQYYFFTDYIQAVETSYFYKVDFTEYDNVFYGSDSVVLSYQMDYMGRTIDIDSSQITNIFREYKTTIPFNILNSTHKCN